VKTVKEIYDFFLQFFSNGGKHLSLMDFMNTVPGFLETKEDGIGSMNVSLGMEYYRICEKMVDDLLLMRIKANPIMGIMTQYLAVHSANTSDPQAFNMALNYGAYDFKYRGFVYTRDYFTHSVLQIEGQHENLLLDTGTAYYIGDNLFVTAAHCVNDVARFNLLLPDDTPLPLREVWFAKGQDREVYDLAIIRVDGELTIPYFMLDAPAVLDEVLVMGFPPIANLPSIQTAETATIGAYQKASTGQVVANTTAYRTQMDFFLVNARVKGGNSGGPVINKEGKVVGTVVALPYELESDLDNPRYDIMGYGQCLPSKYIEELLANPEQLPLHKDGKYYSFR
jgi:serine protease Do